MNKFISLEEFLDFKDETGRPDYKLLPGYGWIIWYNLSKESYEKYGDEGPPLGSKVITLVSGFGGGPGVIRVLDIYDDNRYVALKAGLNERLSIAYAKHWWRYFVVYPDNNDEQIAIAKQIDKIYK
jgi:hypothetical protein